MSVFVTAGINDPPVVDAGDDRSVGEGATVTLVGAASDPEGEAVSFAWIAPDGVTLDDASSATQVFTAPQDLTVDEVLSFSLEATDASGHAASTGVVITVSANNQRLSADAGGPTRPWRKGRR